MSLFALSQLLVGFALCSDILSFQLKKRVHIIACLLVSCSLISLHFVCLHHWTAACLGLIAAIRFFSSLFSTSKMLMGLFLGAAVVAAVVTYEGPLSILGCCGSIMGTVASFSAEDKRLRQLMFIGTSFWLVHNILAATPAAVFMELIFMGSNLVGYFRYYIRPGKQVLN